MEKKIDVTEYKLSFKNLPASFHGCRAGFLADLHNQEIGENNVRLLETIEHAKVDYLFCGGDMIVGRESGENEEDKIHYFLKCLTAIAPVYYSLGNHEERLRAYKGEKENALSEYKEKLKKEGVIVLDNASANIMRGHDKINIAGLSIGIEYYQRWYNRRTLTVANTVQYLDRTGGFTILLAHNPVYFDTYQAYGADLVLSGHVHGGLMVIPGIGGVISPEHILFPHYDYGYFKGKKGQMVISRGLGAHSLPIRINNHAEFVIINLE